MVDVSLHGIHDAWEMVMNGSHSSIDGEFCIPEACVVGEAASVLVDGVVSEPCD